VVLALLEPVKTRCIGIAGFDVIDLVACSALVDDLLVVPLLVAMVR
jgi:hypothetical protein